MAVTLTKELETTIMLALEEARRRKHEYLMLEHVLYAMTVERVGSMMLKACGADPKKLAKGLETFFKESVEEIEVDGDEGHEPEQTAAFRRVLQRAAAHVQSSGRTQIEPGDILAAIYREPQSHAAYLLEQQGVSRLDVLNYISHGVSKDEGGTGAEDKKKAVGQPAGDEDEEEGENANDPLQAYCVDLVKRAAEGKIDPLIGREAELQRTIQVLCGGVATTTRCTSASPASERRRLRKASRSRSTSSAYRSSSRMRRSTRSTWARCSRAPSSAASSRSGSRAWSTPSRRSPTRSSSSTRSTPSSAPERRAAARWTRRTCSSPRWLRASCAASARRPTKSTRPASSATARWSAASRRSK